MGARTDIGPGWHTKEPVRGHDSARPLTPSEKLMELFAHTD